jgi:hypothetical protein
MREVIPLIVFALCLCAFLVNIDWEWRVIMVLMAILSMLVYIAAVLEEMLEKFEQGRAKE